VATQRHDSSQARRLNLQNDQIFSDARLVHSHLVVDPEDVPGEGCLQDLKDDIYAAVVPDRKDSTRSSRPREQRTDARGADLTGTPGPPGTMRTS